MVLTGAIADDEPNHRPRFVGALRHPAVLIILTAMLTGLLAPWVTNRWQVAQRRADEQVGEARAATQRELEVKSAIVIQIGTTSADFVSALELGVIKQNAPKAPAEYRALMTASLTIGSQVAAYFPGSPEGHDSLVVHRWRDYTFSLRDAYFLLTSNQGDDRNDWLQRLNKYLDRGPEHFIGLCFEGTEAFNRHLRRLALDYKKREEELVGAVTGSETILTGTPTPIGGDKAPAVADPEHKTPDLHHFNEHLHPDCDHNPRLPGA